MDKPPFELDTLQYLIDNHSDKLTYQVLAEIPFGHQDFPLYSVEIGKPQGICPTVLFVGGVHGVERIGAQVILAFLSSLLHRLNWDCHLQQLLTRVRLAFVPVVNPVGLFMGTRGNGNRVDLMRNAPIESSEKVSFLVGGQRISPRLPWYRGHGEMELECAALTQYVAQLLNHSSSLVSLDAHSGFGLSDHIWFPYAHSRQYFESANYIYYLKQLFEASYPHHGHYRLAPQSQFYRTHGDIWDYAYQQHQTSNHQSVFTSANLSEGRLACGHAGDGNIAYRNVAQGNIASGDVNRSASTFPIIPPIPFVPLTLEMGSWAWIKKNPRQIFNFAGFFNPQKTHRHHRILRRHTVLMQFLMETAYAQVLEGITPVHAIKLTQQAKQYWYQGESR